MDDLDDDDVTSPVLGRRHYFNANLVRQDITEGRPGLRTKLWISVVRASDCTPIPNSRVDIGHADAFGVYSGYAQQGTSGQTFLRGVQFTDASGVAVFDSIHPGWYSGRTAHIHVKTLPPSGSTLTSPMHFVQALTNRVHTRMPYVTHGQPNTSNGQDGIFDPLTRMSVIGYMQGVLHFEFTVGVF